MFLLDNSFAVRSNEFPLVRAFAEVISINLKVGSPNSSVGIILFERFARIAFTLEEHSSLDTLIPAINPGLPYQGGRYLGNIADALRLLLSSSQNSVNGSGVENNTIGLRTNTTNVAIVLTAGRSRSYLDTINAASKLHAANIYDVYAAGIDGYNARELPIIASNPSLVFAGNSYFSRFTVQRLQQFVLNKLCHGKLIIKIKFDHTMLLELHSM